MVVPHGHGGLLFVLCELGASVAWPLLVVIRVTATPSGSISEPSGMFVVHGLFIGTMVWAGCYQSVLVDLYPLCMLVQLRSLMGFMIFGLVLMLCDSLLRLSHSLSLYPVQSCSCGLNCGSLHLAGSNAYPWTHSELFLMLPLPAARSPGLWVPYKK